ncbi:MAG: DNA-binding response regulator [Burkholderiales bacterium RIFOXYC12_FULL_65_23]|uniref:response regulator n=1 Tax=Malikia spinosa TaxID=86180 RepID=UPI0008AF15C2|nr:MAG: DNA-binding response regulator [Burkholderiales bacterium RIFOXYC12_FULL_65_23]
MTPIRLLVVDDHNLFRRGLIALLAQDSRFSVAGEAADASEAQRSASRLQPDVILLDNHLPGVSGIDAIGGLKAAAPQARVVMLTVSENEEDLAAGLRAGADGYLLKTIDTEELANSIARIWDGDSVISPEMMGKLVGLLRATPGQAAAAAVAPAEAQPPAPARARVAGNDPIHSLSPREGEILRLIAHGASNKLIARELDIAETTVKIHVQHILRKLELSNRVHAAVYATERGWT